jgi:hypothetical protein
MIPCIFQLFFIQGYLNLTGLDVKGVEHQVKLANEIGTEKFDINSHRHFSDI